MTQGIIAVIDDDEDVRDSLKFSLEVEGFVVCRFADASELLSDAALDRFSCLIIDYHMPQMNGLDLVQKLRQRGLRTPCILASNGPSRSVSRRAVAAGVHLIEKTKLADMLVEVIRGALGSRPAETR
jgi:FixJ family two-component response regulator